MRTFLRLVGVVVVLAVLGGGLLGYSWYTERTYAPEVALPVQHETPEVGSVIVEAVASGVGQVWGLEFIPETPLLLATVRQGQLVVIDTVTGEQTLISGAPAVVVSGQGGLLDVAVSPEFVTDQTIFLSYATPGVGGSATAVARGRLDLDTGTLRDLAVIYEAPMMPGGAHFGSRIVIDGAYLFVTLGDRGDKNFEDHIAQDTSNPYGSIIRLYRDGTVPPTNPFVGEDGILDEIYSYGHRNPQGLALRPGTTELWSSEHGEFQGDEINIITAGGNYGWPAAHTACSYVTRQPFGVLPAERPDTVAPVYTWPCGTSGFPPAGMTFYTGSAFPAWQGDLFVAGLAGRALARFRVTDAGVEAQLSLLTDEGWRVRDVTEGPHDGALYVAVEGGAVSVVRIRPGE
jgi:glucose/arabinose dehydrogenase